MIPEDTSHPETAEPGLDAWLAGLSGKATGTDATYATREGEMIRQLLKTHASRLHSTSPSHGARSEAHWERVLQRVRTANSLPTSRTRSSVTEWMQVRISSQRFWLRQTQRLAMAMASVAVLVLAVGLVWLPGAPEDATGEPTLFRGDESIIVLALPAADVEPTLRKVIATLEKNRVAFLLKRLDNGFQIQAKVMPSNAAVNDLSNLGISVPQHGRLNLHFTEK